MTIRMTNRLFGTHPIVVHCPGALPEEWLYLEEAVLAAPARRTCCRDLTILTWNAGGTGVKPPGTLERSLARLGVNPVVVGREETAWENIRKIRLTVEALAKVSTPYVAGLDSSDVLVLDDPSILVQRFRAHHTCELLFNATGPPCWPVLPEFIHFESSLPMVALAHGRHWLNAGAWLGRTEFCRRFFAALADQPPVPGYEWSEQAVIKRAWPRWYPQVQLDYSSTVFQWFKEDPAVIRFERPASPSQTELLRWLGTLGSPVRGVGVGVGSHEGGMADVLLRERDDLTLWLVDPRKPSTDRDGPNTSDSPRFSRAKARARFWTRHAHDRRFFLDEASPAAARRFEDASLDFLVLDDANHLDEGVRAELSAWWPKLRPGGFLCGYGSEDQPDRCVSRAVDEFAAMAERRVDLGIHGLWRIGTVSSGPRAR